MAIKAALAASLLVALITLATATTFTTTITTSDDNGDANPRYQQCKQQVQGRSFRSCQQYFQQRGSPYADADEEVIEMATAAENTHRQQHGIQECCRELQEMDRYQCGCEAIKQAVKQAQQGGRSYQTGQSEQIYQKARSLPRMCKLSEQQCSFRVVFV